MTQHSSGTDPALSTFLTVAYGDGVGSEIMDAALLVLKEAQIYPFVESIELGQRYYENGVRHGIAPDIMPKLERSSVLLKAPHITPPGDEHITPEQWLDEKFKSLLHIYPLRSFSPLIASPYPERDVLFMHAQPACENEKTLLRAAAQVALRHGKTVLHYVAATEDPSLTSEIRALYPDFTIQWQDASSWSLECLRTLHLEAVVTRDIDVNALTQLAHDISGSAMLSCKAHMSPDFLLCEALHDAHAPANPSGILHAACLMLLHMGKADEAQWIENAWLKTIEDGICTGDMVLSIPSETVSAAGFARCVAERLGERPSVLKPVHYERPASVVAAPVK